MKEHLDDPLPHVSIIMQILSQHSIGVSDNGYLSGCGLHEQSCF